MSWGSLPNEMVEVILASLPLVELARVSTTCGTFQALYRRQLAQEHEARCGLAVSYYVREPITTVTGAIIQHLKGEPLNPAFDKFWYSWGVRGEARTLTMSTDSHRRLPGDIISVDEYSATWRGLEVYVPRDRKGVCISFWPWDDRDVEMMALVQAILSEGLAKFIHDAGKWCEIDISWGWELLERLDMSRRVLIRAGLKAQIGPLMQLASRCISIDLESIDTDLVARWVNLTERLQIGEVITPAEDATE